MKKKNLKRNVWRRKKKMLRKKGDATVFLEINARVRMLGRFFKGRVHFELS